MTTDQEWVAHPRYHHVLDMSAAGTRGGARSYHGFSPLSPCVSFDLVLDPALRERISCIDWPLLGSATQLQQFDDDHIWQTVDNMVAASHNKEKQLKKLRDFWGPSQGVSCIVRPASTTYQSVVATSKRLTSVIIIDKNVIQTFTATEVSSYNTKGGGMVLRRRVSAKNFVVA